jgi:hypothetical protein
MTSKPLGETGMQNRILVSADVLTGIEAVRKSGLTNMLDRPAVIKLAAELGFLETAEWIKQHPRKYAKGIFQGFRNDNKGEN